MNTLLQLVGVIIGYIIIWRLFVYFTTKYQATTVRFPNGSYTLVVGDRLHYGTQDGVFHGVEVILPKRLPYIFLDGLSNEGLSGPRHFVSAKHRIVLEGDFNKYFTAYAPNGYQVLTLSILTPDVLIALREAASRYDIEIDGTHVRVISRQRIMRQPLARGAIEAVAMQVLKEIDDKLPSWTADDEAQAATASRITEFSPTVNVLQGKYRIVSILYGLVHGFFGLAVWFAVYDDIVNQRQPTFASTAPELILAFLLFPVLFIYVVYGMPRGWLNWIYAILNMAPNKRAMYWLHWILTGIFIILLIAAVSQSSIN